MVYNLIKFFTELRMERSLSTMEFTEQVGRIAYEAGQLVYEMKKKKDLAISKKGSSYDFVTEADTASQEYIKEQVARLFPGDIVIGEEDGLPDSEVNARLNTNPVGQRIWVIDPLDGTVNYIRDLLGYGVSIGVLTGNTVTSAAIYQPDCDALYTAELGAGAFRNGERIHVAEHERICDSLVGTGVPVSDMQWRSQAKRWIDAVSMEALNVRMLGACVYSLSRLAEGGLDFFFEIGPHAWDLAAGKLLVEEAGGVMTRLDGGTFDFGWGGVLASSEAIHEKAVELLGKADPEISYIRR